MRNIFTVVLLVLCLLNLASSQRLRRINPEPYWYKLAFEGLEDEVRQKRGSVPLAVEFLADPNREAVSIPDGAPTITFGLVVSDMPGYNDAIYSNLHHQGVRTMQWRANSMKKLVVNNTVHYIDVKVISGGPACSNFLILYDYLITVTQVDFLIHPVNPDCQQLAFLAEAYGIPIINSPDYLLGILQSTPSLPYYNLTQLYTVAANYSLLVPSCLVPLVNKGAKTIALMTAGNVGIGVIPFTNALIGPLGLTKVLNDTTFDLEKQKEASRTPRPCSYVQSYIDELKLVKPDIFVYSMGPDFTDEFTRCLRLSDYYPPAYWIFTGNNLPDTADAWMTSHALRNDFWRDKTNVSDPLLVSVRNYTEDFVRQWGKGAISLIAYSATSSTIGTLVIEAVKAAGSTDPAKFRAAMRGLNVSTVIGETYLIDGPQIFYNPFLCRQQGNGPETNDSYIIYPFDAATAREVVYPASVNIDPVFAASLLPRKYWTKPRVIGISVGLTVAAIVLIVLAAVLYYFFVIKYHILAIPKNYPGENAEWAG